jgi:hypothetical protein
MRSFISALALGTAILVAPAANAAALLFNFDAAGSSIAVTENSRLCLPFSGCALSATLLTPFNSLTINEGASETFDFARFDISSGIGGDTDARVETVLAFTSPSIASAGTGGTAFYLRAGSIRRPGVLAGTFTWDNPEQQFTTLDGSKFTFKFNDVVGFAAGGSARSSLTVTVDSIAVVPEPATWAMMIGGFGMAGAMLRRRRSATA